ncbi:MAG TPA: tRNA pseudouridine(55) synthase TruB [Rhodanobacteraceae bacterium]|jgi:tRNA pseudouridine55 synthase|nr:tRNA pseudouridine(55) synthase TruB [Rhodanobacteraceae bacterium]
MKRKDTRDVHGILLFDKPQGFSSNQALQIVRRLYGAAKAGHTGSLDPLATGLLPICFGEATKIAGLLLGSRKAYVTEARLGATTETDDAEGRIVETREVPSLDDASIEAALAVLTGRIRQIPPAYSAIKQGGEPLYRRARRGEAVEVPVREVDVHAFRLVRRTSTLLTLEVECGSGTYVRSLVRDLGERLGCGAHVASLRRLWVEPFLAPRMTGLETLRDVAQAGGTDALDALLIPLEEGLAGYPRIALDEAASARLRHGQVAVVPGAPSGRLVALDPAGKAVALAESVGGRLRSLRGFNPAPAAQERDGQA